MVDREEKILIPREYRVVDLSEKVIPGKVLGPLNDKRLYDIEPFAFPPGETMHKIKMESHISTHVEAPSHFMKARYGIESLDISELPIESFFGEAIFIDLSTSKARQIITETYLEKLGVKKGDIVLIGNSKHKEDEKPWLSKEAVEWLASKEIKMIGFDRSVEVDPQHYPRSLEKYYTHQYMLSNNIPIIEVLANLDKIRKKRFFFMGIPAKMGGLDSFPIRAVALVPK